MTAKTTNTLYWIFTILFAVLMIFSSLGKIQPSEDAHVYEKGGVVRAGALER